VGDPNQLRHISFLSKYRQLIIGNDYGMDEKDIEKYDYRNKSILDVVSENIKKQSRVFMLDEHFRSLPQIVNFSNNEFYNGSMKIMTEKPQHRKSVPLEVKKCNGKRNSKGINEAEAKVAIELIKEIITSEQDLDKSMSHSIGILSPFRNQVDYIYEKIVKNFTLNQMEKHNILAGTAYTFQGEERDIMILSFGVDHKSHRNVFYFISKSDVLNVSITRARTHQIVCTSVDPKMIKEDLLFRRYLEYVFSVSQVDKSSSSSGEKIHDHFLKDVIAELKKLGIIHYPAYSIAGLTIDIVIEYDNRTFGIDLIGCPGIFEDSFSLDRYKMYFRAGLQIIPLEYSGWYFSKERCINKIKEIILYE